MLVETKARVGVFAIALGAYLPQFPTLVPEFEGQYAAFKKTLPDPVEIVDGGIVTTKEQSMAAGDKFRAADVDLVILQLLTYATSYNMLPAVRDLDVPVVLVNVQKKKAPDYANTDIPTWLGELYACGAVGEMVADLERAGFPPSVLDALRLLTHAEGVPYMDYVQALAKNPIARKVKCADLRHNLDTRRIDGAVPAKRDTYLQALAYLEKTE